MYQWKNHHNFESMHQSLEFSIYLSNHITIKSIIPKINNSKVLYPIAQFPMLSYLLSKITPLLNFTKFHS